LEEYFDISGWNDDIEWVKIDDGFKIAKLGEICSVNPSK
jgi:hypothetical protein